MSRASAIDTGSQVAKVTARFGFAEILRDLQGRRGDGWKCGAASAERRS